MTCMQLARVGYLQRALMLVGATAILLGATVALDVWRGSAPMSGDSIEYHEAIIITAAVIALFGFAVLTALAKVQGDDTPRWKMLVLLVLSIGAGIGIGLLLLDDKPGIVW